MNAVTLPKTVIPGPIALAVLAAGASSRMGAHKLLLELGGKPLIAWALASACASRANHVYITLGRNAKEVRAALPSGSYTVLENPHFDQGMGSSLAVTVDALPDSVAGLVIILGDQPFMTSRAIDAVLEEARQSPDYIVVGSVHGKTGHPIYLPKRLFPELKQLAGDQGARLIIERERGELRTAPLDDERIRFDVDTPEDYTRARTMLSSQENTSC